MDVFAGIVADVEDLLRQDPMLGKSLAQNPVKFSSGFCRRVLIREDT